MQLQISVLHIGGEYLLVRICIFFKTSYCTTSPPPAKEAISRAYCVSMDSHGDPVALSLSESDAPESPFSSWNNSSDSTSSSSEDSIVMALGNSLSSALERSLKLWQV